MNVADWLRALGLEEYEAAFRENDVDVEVLPTLTADELKDIGVSSIRHRRRLLEAISVLRSEATQTDIARSSTGPMREFNSPEPAAERRPLSVMFCDLIGSTALSARLDPEDLREVIRAYQARVAFAIQPFGGFIARYVGDGVLIYFGWPEAHETDAASAVRAGLAVAAAVSQTPISNETLRVRIGIATGLVVIGEPIGLGDARQQTAIGETPNRAARLQSLAGPNHVVIDAATHQQIGRLFDCCPLGTIGLKGLPEPVPAWQVLAENRSLGQFEALRSGLTPLIGREEEIELLLRRWEQATAGSGRVVLIAAEPGVGKSRLAAALSERIAPERHVRLRYFCSPHHQDSALYPMIAQMERGAKFEHTDQPTAKFAKLQAFLASAAPPMEDVGLIAELHGLTSVDSAPAPDLTPRRKKEKTFEALLRQVEGLSRQQPVLILFDDIHWIDPSSRELLDRMVERIENWPVLLLGMFRPEFQPPWTGQPHVTTVALTRLNRRDSAAIIANVAGDAELSTEILNAIAERTDGIPLFVEELTKAVLEAAVEAPSPLSAMPYPAVPATLHASLMARLDRLGSAAKEVAQTGAAIGREFSYQLLAPVCDLSTSQLDQALDQLTTAGLIFASGTPPHASYLFKHVLVQDTAYGTLLRSPRQRLHARIISTLEDLFPEIVLVQPAMLAQHCMAAGLADEAIAYWLRAGEQSLVRSATSEAVAQLRKGLDILASLPDGRPRQQQELDLQTALVPALTATTGWAASEVDATLQRVRALAEQLDRPEQFELVILGQFMLRSVRSEHRLALEGCKQIAQLGEARSDPRVQIISLQMQGVCHFQLGEFVDARVLLERAADFDRLAHPALEALSIDPFVARRIYLGLTLACLGYIDQATLLADEALAEARRVGHALTLAFSLVHESWLGWITRMPSVLLEECLALTAAHGHRHFLGWAKAYHGQSLIGLRRAQDSIPYLRQALWEMRACGSVINTPMPLTWLAQAFTELGQIADAQKYLAEAATLVQTNDERLFEAELLHRVPGDLLNAAGDHSGAERHYRQAIRVAEQQSAKLFQLRASVSLARLWRDQGKRTEARDLLAPIYDWFTEGFDTPDLRDAKALLEELA